MPNITISIPQATLDELLPALGYVEGNKTDFLVSHLKEWAKEKVVNHRRSKAVETAISNANKTVDI